MTIYDLLRRFMPGPSWQPYEYEEAKELIDELERLNVFGTTARQVTEQHAHDYQPVTLPARQPVYDRQSGTWDRPETKVVYRCTTCGKEKE